MNTISHAKAASNYSDIYLHYKEDSSVDYSLASAANEYNSVDSTTGLELYLVRGLDHNYPMMIKTQPIH